MATNAEQMIDRSARIESRATCAQRPIAVMIVDEHPILRAGVRELLMLETGVNVAAEAATVDEVPAQSQTLARLDIVLLGIPQPGLSSLDSLLRLRQAHPELPVLVLCTQSDRHFAAQALRCGAAGFVATSDDPSALIAAIRAVADGREFMPSSLAAERPAGNEAGADQAGHHRLSQRELQVFARIARGVPPAAMASELGLSVKTVSTYRARILEKLGMRSNAEIAAYAVRNGLAD